MAPSFEVPTPAPVVAFEFADGAMVSPAPTFVYYYRPHGFRPLELSFNLHMWSELTPAQRNSPSRRRALLETPPTS